MSGPAYFDLPACERCHAPALFPIYERGSLDEGEEAGDELPVGWSCEVCGAERFGIISLQAAHVRLQKFQRALDAWNRERPFTAYPGERALREQVRIRINREKEKAQRLREGRW
jgi:hypothetical protein